MGAEYRVIMPVGLRPHPTSEEVSAAYILAEYFKCDLDFVLRNNQKTADFLDSGEILGIEEPDG